MHVSRILQKAPYETPLLTRRPHYSRRAVLVRLTVRVATPRADTDSSSLPSIYLNSLASGYTGYGGGRGRRTCGGWGNQSILGSGHRCGRAKCTAEDRLSGQSAPLPIASLRSKLQFSSAQRLMFPFQERRSPPPPKPEVSIRQEERRGIPSPTG